MSRPVNTSEGFGTGKGCASCAWALAVHSSAAMPAAVQSKLNKAVNSVEKANIYAEAGLWYNALDEALKLAQKAGQAKLAAAKASGDASGFGVTPSAARACSLPLAG